MKRYLPYLLLLVVSALAYLPFIGRFTYANDDWYLMYGAHAQGADYFAPAYERDRPMRAYVLGPAYELFGDDPLPYHVSAYVFRFLSAGSLFWLLNQVWPKTTSSLRAPKGRSNPLSTGRLLRRGGLDTADKRRLLDQHPPRNDETNFPIPNLLISLLFLLYPGFLSQPNPIDYQSQIVSLFAAMTSLALTVAALKTPKVAFKVVYLVLSFLLAWVYLGLIEYYLGLEVLRLLSVYLVVSKQVDRYTSKQVNTEDAIRNTQYVSSIITL